MSKAPLAFLNRPKINYGAYSFNKTQSQFTKIMPLQRQFIYTKKTMFNIAIINNSDIGSEEYNSNKLLNVLIVRAGFP